LDIQFPPDHDTVIVMVIMTMLAMVMFVSAVVMPRLPVVLGMLVGTGLFVIATGRRLYILIGH